MSNRHNIANTASRVLWSLLLIALVPAVLTFFSFIHFNKLRTNIENRVDTLQEQVFDLESKTFKIATSGLELSLANSHLVQESIYTEQSKYVAEVVLAIERLTSFSTELPVMQKIENNVMSLLGNTKDLIPIMRERTKRNDRIKEVIAFLKQKSPLELTSTEVFSVSSDELHQRELLNKQIELLLGAPFELDHKALRGASETFFSLNEQYLDLYPDHIPLRLEGFHSYLSSLVNSDESIFFDCSLVLTLNERINENSLLSLFLAELLVKNLKELISSHSIVIDTERKGINRLRDFLLLSIAVAAIVSNILFLKLKWLIQNTIISRIVRLSDFTTASAERRNAILPQSPNNDEIASMEKSVHFFIEQQNTLEKKISDTLKIRTEQLSLESKIVDAYFSGSSDGLSIVKDDGSILRSNAAFKKIFPDLNKDEVHYIGQIFANHLSDTSTTTFKAASDRDYRIRNIPIRTSSKALLSLYMFEDITEYIETEKKMHNLTKLRLLGELSGSIAHDFNNTLSVFQGITHLLTDDNYVRESRATAVRLLQAAIDQGSAITTQLLDTTRTNVFSKNNCAANQILQECEALAEQMNMGKVIISLDERSTTPIDSKPELLINALLNLFSNAKDASPQSSEVILRCFDEKIDSNDWVVFEVQDFGEGIKPEHLTRITEPLFTTKPFGKGTGIGLSSVRRFTKENGGELDIISVVGSGTTISIRLPTNTVAREVPMSTSSPTNKPILVVDDNYMFGDLLCKQLQHIGYSTDLALSLEEVDKLISNSHNWDIIICDVHLGLAHGSDVLKLCRKNQIGKKFIFMSGNLAPKDINSIGSYTILNKPFRFDKIIHLLETT